MKLKLSLILFMFVAGVEGVHAQGLESSTGPDYHAYVSSGPAIKDNPEFGPLQVEVARLAKPNSASYYLLQTESLDDVASVLIWCKQFKEYIGSADLIRPN